MLHLIVKTVLENLVINTEIQFLHQVVDGLIGHGKLHGMKMQEIYGKKIHGL